MYLLLALLPAALADFSLGSWPPPSDLTSRDSLVAAAFADLSAALEQHVALGDGANTTNTTYATDLTGLPDLTFSLGLFSLHDADAETLQFHHTSRETAAAANGTRQVDADSIYRLASVTKVLTVLTGLVHLDDADWERPLADIFPELGLSARPAEQDAADDATITVAWRDITPRSLAAQLGGMSRDGFPSLAELEILQLLGTADPAAMGLPPLLGTNDTLGNPPCLALLLAPGSDGSCPESPYLASVAGRPPVFAPWTTPAYSDNGFALLGLAMARLVNEKSNKTDKTDFASLLQEGVLRPLNMTSSGAALPPTADWHRSVIGSLAAFAINSSVYASTGGGYASLRDMARLGRGILGSALLPPVRTRRWLQPVSLTARLQYAVGAPWEIQRMTLASGKVVDLYSKLGDSGDYTAYLILLPDYGVGVNILSFATRLAYRVAVVSPLADLVVNILVPALDAEAAREAAAQFAGSYTDQTTAGTSLTLTVNGTDPGLVISAWTSNGTDVLRSPLADYLGRQPWRLVPSIADAAQKRRAFRLVTPADRPMAQPPVGPELFAGAGFEAADWITADAVTYGGVGVTLFVFDVDDSGAATAVSPAAFRQTLQRR